MNDTRTDQQMAIAEARKTRRSFQITVGEISGAVADLGILVPLATALILVNGLDAGSVLLCAGLLIVATGLVFRVPFPVQPLKALTAVAVAQQLSPGMIHAAGLEIGAFLLLLSLGNVADVIARVFTMPVVRALQLGVGLLLVVTALKLVANPPAVFVGTPPTPWPWVLLAASFGGVVLAARTKHYWLGIAILAAGVVAALASAGATFDGPALTLPTVAVPVLHDFAGAFLLLVVPQLPLTFGNAVVATNELEHEYFGDAARRVTPSRVCLSAGIGNVASGLLGGMPMCHGAGGLTAHARLGARTAGMNLVLGGAFVVLGLFFAAQVPVILGLLPVWGLAGFLVYAGLRHGWLVADLRGFDLAVAVVAGGLGAWFGNLAITAGLALVAVHGATLVRRVSTSRRYP
jgi:SulP family sulfate permease